MLEFKQKEIKRIKSNENKLKSCNWTADNCSMLIEYLLSSEITFWDLSKIWSIFTFSLMHNMKHSYYPDDFIRISPEIHYDETNKKLVIIISFMGYAWYTLRQSCIFLIHYTTRRKVASLSELYCYFSRKCSCVIHSLAPPAQTFTAKIHVATATVLNHSHSLRIALVRKNVSHHWFFPVVGCYFFLQ